MKHIETDLLIIGGGAAGMGAAIAAAKEDVPAVIVERNERLGGILNQCIHNGFGLHYFKKELTGPEYAHECEMLLKGLPIKFLAERFLIDVNEKEKEVYFASETGIEVVKCKALVYAAGARERPFGSLLIPGARVSGIYTAGVAQRLTNLENRLPGKKAVILGSGDIGLIMARRLTLEGMKVEAVCERMPFPGGLERNINQCLRDFGIPLLLSTSVTEVRGDGRLQEIITSRLDENYNVIPGSQRAWSADTLILSVGLVPSTTPIMHVAPVDPRTRGVIVDSEMRTEKEWIFAAGNCVVIYDLVDFVTREGEIAGRTAARYIKGEKPTARYPIKKGTNIGVCNPSLYAEGSECELYLRVIRPMEKGKVVVRDGDQVIHETKKAAHIPSEMVHFKIKKDTLPTGKNISVEMVSV